MHFPRSIDFIKGEYDDFLPMIVFHFLCFIRFIHGYNALAPFELSSTFSTEFHITALRIVKRNGFFFSDVNKINSSNVMQCNASVKKLIRSHLALTELPHVVFLYKQQQTKKKKTTTTNIFIHQIDSVYVCVSTLQLISQSKLRKKT